MEVSAMTIYRTKEHRKIWEQFNNACIMPGMHIHHIDGNKNNNEPFNLLLCSPVEHYEIHLKQGDYGAAILLWKNCLKNSDIDISKVSSKRLKLTHKRMKERDPILYSESQRKKSLGKKRTEEQKQNYKIGSKKRLSDPSFTERLSLACKGKRKIIKCPYCGVCGGGGNMRRYHFNNCKHK
jgi:hypothetical protein